ncbi:hypothetical protein Tel_16985 (plasmid) [Candidatus Tenderia electrophaga]|jgi:serine/threonine-protein kinase HipA|uniref:Phosphatidylinositol kinase n=1 Tax=Candidatus Tenderia electrophaga TaxID=1748243 RepID=A0A0S2TIG3_9GAMM|nr:hypothetical protein Tel_16985 [Candidatus Tenderia electrophaga]
MIHLEVWLTLPDGERIQAGEIVTADPDAEHGGALQGEYRYCTDYLDSPRAFPLDPVALPLQDRIFNANNPRSGVHQVFEDSLPDDWGRQLLVRRYRLPRGRQRPPQLLSCIGISALGALAFINKDRPQPESNAAGLPDLPALLQAAARYEQGELAQGDELQLLFQAGSSPGGARPKVLVEEQGRGWIAKFPSARDRFDVVRLEAASLELARRSGLVVPEFRLVDAAGRAVLLVRRFDETGEGGRRHLVSMRTLLQVENYYNCAYHDVADIVRCHSDHPQQDLAAVYRWMVFNAALGNTDDHLKNIMMQHDDDGWALAPLYDLVPNINRNLEHVLMFDTSFYPPDKAGLVGMAAKFGLSKRQAEAIVEAVWEALTRWESVFAEQGVPDADIVRLRPDISGRLAAKD